MFPIKDVDILLTTGCNLDCSYCFEHTRDKPHDISMAKLRDEYLNKGYVQSVSFFGGEPLLRLDIIEEHMRLFPEDRRTSYIITNGTLIPSVAERLKDMKARLQISLDGCEKANDLNRGVGTYKQVKKALQVCYDNGIEWTLHGVLPKNTFSYFTESMKDYYYTYLKYEKISDGDYSVLANNLSSLVTEEEFTDEDIDMLLSEFEKTAEWIKSLELSIENKALLFDALLAKSNTVPSAKCSAGTTFLLINGSYNMYACHRAFTAEENETSHKSLGNIFDDDINLESLNYFTALYWMKNKAGEYSYIDNKKYIGNTAWSYYCPTANYETSNGLVLDYVSTNYSVLLLEINRWINWARKHYDFGLTASSEGI
jgi:sulfatase maturation enzyme AslB (radical SAM superfamily)